MASAEDVNPELVRRMVGVLQHRGPDDSGFHTEAHAAMGMRRLAIIDLAGGRQPVRNEDGSVVAVFNGELYNFPQLRAELTRQGHRLTGTGDSECLVHLYEEHGDELLHRLRGMFALAIWDARRRRLLLARDRMGKKPLFYASRGPRLTFASELKALLQDPDLPRRVDRVALNHYLTLGYVPAPWSILEEVRKLPPGHLLVWQDGRAEIRRYWQLVFRPRPPLSEAEACAQLREKLLEATRIRMLSERPIGALLSGGVDSSAVVAAMARQSAEPVKTFCIGFADSRFDEREYARLVSQRYGTDHHELIVTAAARAVLPTLAWHFDEPFADSSAIPSYQVAKLSREHVTVVLNGDGGDECFGGYRRYALTVAYGGLPVPKLPVFDRLGSALTRRSASRTWQRTVGRALTLLGHPASERYARLMSYFTPEQKEALYAEPLRNEVDPADSIRLVKSAMAGSTADCEAGRAMEADINLYLPGDLLFKIDIATMANSLEARSPFLDHQMVEWAASLPTRLKVGPLRTKHVLKRAVADWLPAQVLNRPKRGFGVPLDSWLRGELRDLAHDLLTDQTARARGLFRPETVLRLLQEHDMGIDHGERLWALIQLENWHRTFGTPSEHCVAELAR
jgi:asparagine synthase (glutamine-hydrolysing)